MGQRFFRSVNLRQATALRCGCSLCNDAAPHTRAYQSARQRHMHALWWGGACQVTRRACVTQKRTHSGIPHQKLNPRTAEKKLKNCKMQRSLPEVVACCHSGDSFQLGARMSTNSASLGGHSTAPACRTALFASVSPMTAARSGCSGCSGSEVLRAAR